MKQEIKVPSIGESVNEVTLATWLVNDGDYVEIDQALAEFESDKATFELPAEVAGVISRIAKEGDDIKIGAVVATIDTDASKPESTSKKEDIERKNRNKDMKRLLQSKTIQAMLLVRHRQQPKKY
jgi:2-oxoglutarate dehydrogenase E2 component (dihydrolipoamide succinyltransferase)